MGHHLLSKMDPILKPATPAWCKKLPKVELHAHLSGSIRTETIRKLVNEPEGEHIRARASELLDVKSGRSLRQCFDLFPVVHQLVNNASTLRTVTLQVLEDFASENTVYLELRTTPRKCETLSGQEYLKTVLEAMADYHAQNPEGMVSRLIVSISRHLPISVAEETISITEKLLLSDDTRLKELIVGMELSGNPYKGKWSDFVHIFTYVRRNLDLPISLHFGEIANEEECLEMLDFKPDRIGHAVTISDEVANRMIAQHPTVGVEICLTSNLMTKSVEAISKHRVITTFIPANHPLCLCTDDCGIFDTTLSDEYGRLVACLNLSPAEAQSLAVRGIEMAFCRDERVLNHVRGMAERLIDN